MQLPDPVQEEPDPQPASEFDAAETYNKGYYVAVVNTVNEEMGPLLQLRQGRPPLA